MIINDVNYNPCFSWNPSTRHHASQHQLLGAQGVKPALWPSFNLHTKNVSHMVGWKIPYGGSNKKITDGPFISHIVVDNI